MGQFSSKRRETKSKTNGITLANQNTVHNAMNQSEFKANVDIGAKRGKTGAIKARLIWPLIG